MTAALLALAGCDRAPSPAVDRTATDVQQILAELREDPGLLPMVPLFDRPVVLLLLSGSDQAIRIEGPPTVLPTPSFKLERALAQQREHQPPLWIVVTNAAGDVQYWLPLDPRPRIRVSVPPPPGETKTGAKGGMLPLEELVVPVRIPFVRDGVVGFYRLDDTVVSRWSFGDEPTDPLVELKP